MRELMNLELQNVFYYFEEICRIPHGSGNTQQISDYLVEFAKKRNLEHYQDEAGNVIIIKEASAGYVDHEPVMLQGHMDMVTVKDADCTLDLCKDGLELVVDGDRLMARGTSLGGDDGIAVAYGLALLDGNYKHPRIELVVTVDEEVGMNGARVIDVTPLKAKSLINLDSEEEGIFLAGCAGGARVNMSMECEMAKRKGISCSISVSGLQGGHSGAEIHRERGNAICILGRILARLSTRMELCISALEGGVADNAIPTDAKAEILITGYENGNGTQRFMQGGFSEQECRALLLHTCEKQGKELAEELADKDDEIKIEALCHGMDEKEVVEEELSKKMIYLLNAIPHGVQAMSAAMPGLVETSLNPGILTMSKEEVVVSLSVRSSIDSAKEALIGQLKSIAQLSGANVEVSGEYPGWSYRKDSPLRDTMVQVYKLLYQREPKVEAIHAGVECGLLAYKIQELDCVSLGPDMKNIHTTKEELSISSTIRVWNYLLKVLEVL